MFFTLMVLVAFLHEDGLLAVYRMEGDTIRCSSEDVIIAKGRHNSISESRLIQGLIIPKRMELEDMTKSLKESNIATEVCVKAAGLIIKPSKSVWTLCICSIIAMI